MSVTLLAMVGVGVDGAWVFAQHRHLQSAVDLAALAGARDLPDASAGRASAAAFATHNGYTDDAAAQVDVTATTPWGGDPQRIRVEASRPVPLFFVPVLGIKTIHIRATATARYVPATVGYAMFARHGQCDSGSESNNRLAIDISGNSSSTIVGPIHSNSGFTASGNNNVSSGAATHVCTNGGAYTREVYVGSNTNAFGGSSAPTATSWRADPYIAVPFNPATGAGCDYYFSGNRSFPNDFNSGWAGWENYAARKLRTGMSYCVNGNLVVQAPVTGEGVAFAATGLVTFPDASMRFNQTQAHSSGLLVYTSHNPAFHDAAIRLSGGSAIFGAASGTGMNRTVTFSATLYAPNGKIELSGNDHQLYGGLIAESIRLNGNRHTIVGDADIPEVLQLVE